MIRFELESYNFALTNDQFNTIAAIIQKDTSLDYDVVEHDATGSVWLWVHHEQEPGGGNPTRHWIDVDGNVSLVEDVDWDWNEEGVGAPTPSETDKE